MVFIDDSFFYISLIIQNSDDISTWQWKKLDFKIGTPSKIRCMAMATTEPINLAKLVEDLS